MLLLIREPKITVSPPSVPSLPSVVFPFTVRFPETVTLSGKPIVNV